MAPDALKGIRNLYFHGDMEPRLRSPVNRRG